MQLVASLGVILVGLFLVNVDDTTSGMRVYGWVLVAVGAFGLVLRFVISRVGGDQGPRGRLGEPGPPPR